MSSTSAGPLAASRWPASWSACAKCSDLPRWSLTAMVRGREAIAHVIGTCAASLNPAECRSGLPARIGCPPVIAAAAGRKRVGDRPQLVLGQPAVVQVRRVAEAVRQRFAARRHLELPAGELRHDHVSVTEIDAVARLV